MQKLRLLHILILIIGLFSFLIYVFPVQAQTPTPPFTRETLIHAIQIRAQHDVEQGLQHKSPTDLAVLFEKDATDVGMPMSEVVEVYETAYQTSLGNRSPMDEVKDLFQPNMGWVVAGILAILLILRDVIKDYLTRFFKWIFESIYQLVAGLYPFWMFTLQRYRQALEKEYQELKISFREERPLKMAEIYVPLKVSGNINRDAVDAYQEIQSRQKLVIVGSPGAGKSMLMRHLTLTYARRGLSDLRNQPVPILVELTRLDGSEMLLVDHLVEAMVHAGFPNALDFINAFLKNGKLLLLLDGLDEVSSQSRGGVIRQITDLLKKYPQTRVVVTCRTQVYREEFSEHSFKKLEIVEFNDHQIRRFLTAWEPDMPIAEGKSIEHFLRTLHERPSIMALARNPLLLTMMAHLYTDTAFVLPHSRTEFYESSTALFLDRHRERSTYKTNQKQFILQDLALFNHSGQSGGDRRSIDLVVALKQIQKVLPRLSLSEEDAQQVLDEIIERSGLLIPVDGGVRYQFAHLTLQEFFAAKALMSEPKKLIDFFKKDKDAWREVVRLWCGIGHDSTNLIRHIFVEDPILAFECLGDAQQVDSVYANELIRLFKEHITEALTRENIAHALALVASDPRPRGIDLFNFLRDKIHSENKTEQLAAAKILSLTNLPAAAQALADWHYDNTTRQYLYAMGDVAVPVLVSMAEKGGYWAFDGLLTIGSPVAALGLVELLWDEEAEIAYKAAWRLAVLFSKPNIEDALRLVNLTVKQRRFKQFDWVWEPFNEPDNSALQVIAGRCAYLISTTPQYALPEYKSLFSNFDQRLAVPILINQQKENHVQDFLRNTLSKRALHILSPNNVITPTITDWRNINRPLDYYFSTSWQSKGIKLLLIFICLLNLWGVINFFSNTLQFSKQTNSIVGLWGIVMLIVCVLVATKKLDYDLAKAWFYIVLLGLIAVSTKYSSNIILDFLIIYCITFGIVRLSIWSNLLDSIEEAQGIISGCALVIAVPICAVIGSVIGIYINVFRNKIFEPLIFYAIVGGYIAITATEITAILNRRRSNLISRPEPDYFANNWFFQTLFGIIIGSIAGIIIGFNNGSISKITSSTFFSYGYNGLIIGGALPVAIIILIFLGVFIISLFKNKNFPNLLVTLVALSAYLLSRQMLYMQWGWQYSTYFWGIWAASFMFLLWFGNFQTRRAANPLSGVLDDE
ncbi:MAG: NACHT domain-containing protein [Anaerolineae bacterium]|nr:NACHT domain-containing protein [Anaerolineae bacterium]